MEKGLIPEKYPQGDLFICDVADAILKDIMPQMEHPFYSLSKKPYKEARRYEHNGNWIEIIPTIKGAATIYDKDILIYCISQIIAKMKKGEEVSKRVRINSKDLLVFTNRGLGGKDYKALSEAILRISGTTITTNIKTGDEEQTSFFSLIDSASIKRKHGLNGRLLSCDITLSDWVFNAVAAKEVLTLHPDYFRLSKPLEKRVYEIARKHCGHQLTWSIEISNLLKKTGSQSPLKRFKQLIKELSNSNHLPDYLVKLENNKIVFTNKNHENMNKWFDKEQESTENMPFPVLKSGTLETAKKVAPRYDVYFLQEEWLDFWASTGKAKLNNPDGSFIAFCKKRYERNPNP